MSAADTDSGSGEAASPRARPRGRPRAGGTVDTRARIVAAAGKEFTERGYEAASLRAIARRAGVDARLVHHYFTDKADLFAETVRVPLRPDKLIVAVLSGPRDEIGASLVRMLLTEASVPATRDRLVVLLRTVVGGNPASFVLKQFLVREVFHKIAASLDSADAELRASLAASQMVGLLLTRFVLRIEPLASASIEDLVARIGPVIQWHLLGYSPSSQRLTE